MLRSLRRQCKAIARQWRREPFWASALVSLALLVAVGGPCSCILHCATHGTPHRGTTSHEHGAGHHGHAAQTGDVVTVDVAPALAGTQDNAERSNGQTMHCPAHEVLTALTIAIVLSPLLLLPLHGVAWAAPGQHLLPLSVVFPPPPRPPRYAPSFAS